MPSSLRCLEEATREASATACSSERRGGAPHAEMQAQYIGRHVDVQADGENDALLAGDLLQMLHVRDRVDHEGEGAPLLDLLAKRDQPAFFPDRISQQQIVKARRAQMERFGRGEAHQPGKAVVQLQKVFENTDAADGFAGNPNRLSIALQPDLLCILLQKIQVDEGERLWNTGKGRLVIAIIPHGQASSFLYESSNTKIFLKILYILSFCVDSSRVFRRDSPEMTNVRM